MANYPGSKAYTVPSLISIKDSGTITTVPPGSLPRGGTIADRTTNRKLRGIGRSVT